MPKKLSFFETVTAAVNDIAKHGFDNVARVRRWVEAIRRAAVADVAVTPEAMQGKLGGFLRGIYGRLVGKGLILKNHPGANRFTLDKVKPALRGELDKRILASANLIRLNREKAIEDTLRRFEGWSTSIPKGGSKVVDKNDEKANVSKALKQLPFVERRVIIDQGHKFTASLNQILAEDGGAIAAEWHSNFRQINYNFREDHKERDRKVYAIRDSWAHKAGYINKGDGYTDEMTQPAEEPFCRCYYRYLYHLEDLPPSMLTQKGREAEDRANAMMQQ